MESELYEEMAQLEQDHWWFRGRRTVIQSTLNRHLPRGERLKILDVGSGTGGMLPLLAQFGELVALEGSDDALAHLRQKLPPGSQVIQGRLPDAVPADATFDLATAFDVLEHLEEPVATLQRMRAALKPGGQLVCTVPAFPFLWSEHDTVHHHFRRYTRATLTAELTQAGFELERMSYFNSLLFAPIAAARLLGKLRKQQGRSDVRLPPRPVNRLLETLFASEQYLVPRVSLPVGVSLLAVARQPAV